MHTTAGGKDMKLLSIENNMGLYLGESGQYIHVDKITKEDILRLANLTLKEDVEFDAYIFKWIIYGHFDYLSSEWIRA